MHAILINFVAKHDSMLVVAVGGFEPSNNLLTYDIAEGRFTLASSVRDFA